jgi:hypothetical protein
MKLPDDAVAVPSYLNDNPLVVQHTTVPSTLMTIVSRTDTHMIVAASDMARHNNKLYLGALLSKDRRVIYWVNTSKPLPS